MGRRMPRTHGARPGPMRSAGPHEGRDTGPHVGEGVFTVGPVLYRGAVGAVCAPCRWLAVWGQTVRRWGKALLCALDNVV